MGTWLGRSPSSSCVHNWKTRFDRQGPERPRCNSRCHIPGASQGRLRTSDSSASSTRSSRCPRDILCSCISCHSVPIHQRFHSIRLHHRRHFRRRVSRRPHDHNPPRNFLPRGRQCGDVVWEHTVPCSHQHPVFPLSCAS